MILSQYADTLRQGLIVAAESAGEEARAFAERLIAPLESTTRLVLLEALSEAAAEITRELAPGSVEVRLRGRDPEFVVTPPPAEQSFGSGSTQGARGSFEGDEGGASRTTLRLPDRLKAMVDDAAGREGLSVNAWLVRIIAAGLEAATGDRAVHRPGPSAGQKYTGWAR